MHISDCKSTVLHFYTLKIEIYISTVKVLYYVGKGSLFQIRNQLAQDMGVPFVMLSYISLQSAQGAKKQDK